MDKVKLHQCKECGLFYKSSKVAKDCEEHCKKYKACSIDIIKHAIKK